MKNPVYVDHVMTSFLFIETCFSCCFRRRGNE